MMTTGIQRIYKAESVEFTIVPNWVVRDPSYSPNTFRLLAYLLSHENGYELTYGQIERQTTLGRYAINEAAKFLIRQGWLEWKQEKGQDGKWLAKTWIIKNPDADQSIADRATTESTRTGTTNGHIENNLLEKTTVKKTTLNENENSKLFDDFWNEYPRKEGKKPAFKAFSSALKRATYEDLMAGLLRYKQSKKVYEGYIMLPGRWLNEDHWEDSLEPAVGTVGSELNAKRRERELERSRQFLAEEKKHREESAPAPKCKHGKNIALCNPCLKDLNDA